MILPTAHIVRKSNTIEKKIRKEYIVIDIDKEKIYRFNRSAEMIWRLTSKKIIFSDLISNFCKEFDITQEDASKDINRFIKSYKDLFVITN